MSRYGNNIDFTMVRAVYSVTTGLILLKRSSVYDASLYVSLN